MKRLVLLILLTLLIVNIEGAVQAQNITLSVAPAHTTIVAKPGAALSTIYTIVNKGDPTFATIGVSPIKPNTANGPAQILPGRADGVRFTSGDEAVVLDKSFFLQAKEAITVSLDISIPKDLQETDYYYAVVVKTEPPPGTEGGISLRLQQQILSQVYITVTRTGIAQLKPKIALFSISPHKELRLSSSTRIVDNEEAIPISLTIANNGNNAFVTKGVIKTSSLFSSSTTQIPDQFILGSSLKTLDIPPATGVFIGPVTMSVELSYGDSGIKNYSKISFFAFPFRLWPALLILIFATALLFWMNKRRGNR